MSDLVVKSQFGLQLLHWAISQSDIWHLAHRCSQLVQKINEPLEKSAYVLDSLFDMDDDDMQMHCSGMRDLHLNRMHFDDEDDYNGEQMQRFDNNNNNVSGNGNAIRAANARPGIYSFWKYFRTEGEWTMDNLFEKLMDSRCRVCRWPSMKSRLLNYFVFVECVSESVLIELINYVNGRKFRLRRRQIDRALKGSSSSLLLSIHPSVRER